MSFIRKCFGRDGYFRNLDDLVEEDHLTKMSLKQSWRIFRSVSPYFWPKGELGLKTRVVISAILVGAGKGIDAYSPQVYSNVIDTLTPGTGSEDSSGKCSSLLTPRFLLSLGFSSAIRRVELSLHFVGRYTPNHLSECLAVRYKTDCSTHI